jgi:hypothetical protein
MWILKLLLDFNTIMIMSYWKRLLGWLTLGFLVTFSLLGGGYLFLLLSQKLKMLQTSN